MPVTLSSKLGRQIHSGGSYIRTAAGTGDEPSAAVVAQPAAVRQVPYLYHPDGRLLHRQHSHLAQLDLQDAPDAPHAQLGPAHLHQVPTTTAAAPETAGSSAISTGISRRNYTVSHRNEATYFPLCLRICVHVHFRCFNYRNVA